MPSPWQALESKKVLGLRQKKTGKNSAGPTCNCSVLGNAVRGYQDGREQESVAYRS